MEHVSCWRRHTSSSAVDGTLILNNQCVHTCVCPILVHTVTLQHSSGRCGLVYSSTLEGCCRRRKQATPNLKIVCQNFAAFVWKHCTACALSLICFYVVFGFQKYIGYVISGAFWKDVEMEVLGWPARSCTLSWRNISKIQRRVWTCRPASVK